MVAADGPVLLFDGHCTLCSRTVDRVLALERDASLRFGALQSDEARAFLTSVVGGAEADRLLESTSGGPGSLVLVEAGRIYTHSTAALRLARHLRAPFSWSRVLLVIPRPVRDAVYRWVARHRYRWFGRRDACRVPSADLRARFL